MASKKRKKEEAIVVEAVNGLPYTNLIKRVLDYVVLGLCLVCLLSLVIPILRMWYPLPNKPTYTNYFVPGFSFIFGNEIDYNISETTTRTLTLKFNVRYFLSYLSILISAGFVGLGYLKNLSKYKKFFRLASAVLFATAFALIFTYNKELYTVVRNYSGISNLIKEIEFTWYGIVHLVSLALGTLVMFYQACCEKIVKN